MLGEATGLQPSPVQNLLTKYGRVFLFVVSRTSWYPKVHLLHGFSWKNKRFFFLCWIDFIAAKSVTIGFGIWDILNVGDSIYHLYFYNPFTREDIKLHTELCDTNYACIIVVESWEKIIQSMILSFELIGTWSFNFLLLTPFFLIKLQVPYWNEHKKKMAVLCLAGELNKQLC